MKKKKKKRFLNIKKMQLYNIVRLFKWVKQILGFDFIYFDLKLFNYIILIIIFKI